MKYGMKYINLRMSITWYETYNVNIHVHCMVIDHKHTNTEDKRNHNIIMIVQIINMATYHTPIYSQIRLFVKIPSPLSKRMSLNVLVTIPLSSQS